VLPGTAAVPKLIRILRRDAEAAAPSLLTESNAQRELMHASVEVHPPGQTQ